MNSCLECGADNAEDVIYCVKCGKRLAPPQPPPEFWRYNTEDLGGPRPVQPIPPAYQPPPPPYSNQPPPYAPEQGSQQRQSYAPPRPGYAQPPQGYGPPQHNVRQYGPPAQYQPPQPAPYPPAPLAQASSSSSLPQMGMTLAVVVACIVLLGLVPCLGWLNWFALIFGKVSLVMCIIAVASEKDPGRRSKAVTGLILLCVALGVAVIRLTLSLILGGGCL